VPVILRKKGVARQALAQTITEFPLPTANSVLAGITTAPEQGRVCKYLNIGVQN
jgi:hypothetical protein